MNGHRISAFQEPKPEETILLRWDEGDYAGLVVRCRKECSIGLYEDLSIEAVALPDVLARIQRFADEVLIEWNLDDKNGQSLPATAHGLSSIPGSLVRDILIRYFERIVGVPIPLGDLSSNGSGLEEPSPKNSRALAFTSRSRNGSASRRTRSRAGQ